MSDSLEALDLARRDATARRTVGRSPEAPGSLRVVMGASALFGVALVFAILVMARIGGAAPPPAPAVIREPSVVAATTARPVSPTLARDTLTARVHRGDASPEEIVRLRALCEPLDPPCVADCDARLAAMVIAPR